MFGWIFPSHGRDSESAIPPGPFRSGQHAGAAQRQSGDVLWPTTPRIGKAGTGDVMEIS